MSDSSSRRTDLPAAQGDRTGWPWDSPPSGRAAAPDRGPAQSKVSVVVPSYNQGRFIEATIRSVLLQDYPDIELIVMDGGSRDETVDVLRRYDPWIDHWVSEPDRGQTHAINKGVELATGEIVTYLNSDDLLHPGAVSRIVEGFESHPEAAVVHGKCVYVDEVGGERFRQDATIDGFLDYLRIWERFPTGNYITQPEAFIRREALAAVGPFREELHSVMDFEMWLRLLSRGFVFRPIPHPIAHFRTYPAQKSSVDPGHELFAVIEEYIRSPTAGVTAEAQRDLLSELPAARAQLLVRAAIAANILGRYSRAVRYCLAAVRHHPPVLATYPFWSVLAQPLRRLLPVRHGTSGRRLFSGGSPERGEG